MSSRSNQLGNHSLPLTTQRSLLQWCPQDVKLSPGGAVHTTHNGKADRNGRSRTGTGVETIGLGTRNPRKSLTQSVRSSASELTRLKQQLQAAEKLATVGRMIAGVAHDFNNVLTAILLYAELLAAQTGNGGSSRRHVDEIRMAAQRGAALVHRILAYVRSPELQLCSVDEQLRTLHDMISRLLGPEVKFAVFSGAEGAKVQMDAAQFQQVLLNLAMNARDAMPDGGKLRIASSNISLTLAQAKRWKLAPGRYVALKVTDTGCGMDAHVLAHLFDPFFTTKRKGSGLGMPAVQQAVQESGGVIAVESQPGKGTTVTILLPRVSRAAKRVLKQAIHSRIHKPTFHPPSAGAASTPAAG